MVIHDKSIPTEIMQKSKVHHGMSYTSVKERREKGWSRKGQLLYV